MQTEKKRGDLASVASSKIHWGETEESVRTWLKVQGIAGEDADQILKRAWIERSISIRKRALLGLAISGIGLAIGVMTWNLNVRGYPIFILAASASAFFQYLYRLLRGGMVGAVDE